MFNQACETNTSDDEVTLNMNEHGWLTHMH